jgi:tryptophanyl-tRNA synthetase
MSKPVVLTGIRANNDLHIGNYFGALLPMIDMAARRAGDYQINLFVPDLHSFTTPVDHKLLYEQITHNLKLFVAAGLPLDNPDIHIYRQSYIPAHSELTWILDCFTGFGEMSRMTQFKDKSGKLDEDRISVGLFNYPVLMAADILLYGASYVPVGDDQTQHLEFTRDIAMRMNGRFGELFAIPKPVKDQHAFFGNDQGLRIKDLVDPTKKMSKSDENGKGIIFLGDNPDDAAKKIMGATTDSLGSIHFDRENQPGISNLLQILALLAGKPLDTVIQEYEGKSGYGELKAAVASHIKTFLQTFQACLKAVDEDALRTKLETSEAAMREVASKTLAKVQRAVGLRPQERSSSHVRSGSLAKPAAISFDDFAKLDIRIGTVLTAELVENSNKLISLTIDLGSEKRIIVTGMREFYEPSSFIGKQLPILANLQPQTFRGVTSHGMLMAVEGGAGPILLLPEQDVPTGSPLE